MKKRILFINGHLNLGGIERSLVDILRNFDCSKYDVDLMLFQGEGDYRDEISSGINIYSYDVTTTYGPLLQTLWKAFISLSLFQFLYRLATSLGKPLVIMKLFCTPCHKHYDVVISFRPGLSNSIATKCINAHKHISWWHHGEMNLSRAEKQILAEEYRLCDKIVTVSKSCTRMLQQEFPKYVGKFVTIPNMVFTEEILAKSLLYKPVRVNALNIVTVGRLTPEKNTSFCIDIASRLKSQNIPFHWNIIGGGEEYDNLCQKIVRNDVSDFVTLLGPLSNPYPYIANSDIYFHPSLVESQGLTILEAMTLGIPTISVASDGPKEYITNGRNGILIEPSVNEAVIAISQIYSNSSFKEGIVTAGYHTINQFSPKSTITKIEHLID